MKKILFAAALTVSFLTTLTAQASERSPFTNIGYGVVFGWGDFIKVDNFEFWNEDKTHYLIEVNGVDYKDILKKARNIHGKNYKCRLAEHFVETMGQIGIKIGETVNLKLYIFDGSHKVFDVTNVPVTADNLDDVRFETNFCL